MDGTRTVVARVATAAVAIFGVFLVIGSAIRRTPALLEWDHDVTVWMVRDRSDALVAVVRGFGTPVADTWTVIGTLIGASAVLIATGRRRHAIFLVAGVVLELALFLSVVNLVGRPRPITDHIGPLPGPPSFPSGHVAVSVVLYGGLVLVVLSIRRVRASARAVLVTLVVVTSTIVLLSRAYAGLHYLSDAVGGGLLGLAVLATMATSGLLPREADT